MRRFSRGHYAVLWAQAILVCVLAGVYGPAKGSADRPARAAMAQADSGFELACRWAEAVKNRDGRAQYALMTKRLQRAVLDDFLSKNWVTGTSSPWVESYTVQAGGDRAKVTFRMASSTGPFGNCSRELFFSREDGPLRISRITPPVWETAAAGATYAPRASPPVLHAAAFCRPAQA